MGETEGVGGSRGFHQEFGQPDARGAAFHPEVEQSPEAHRGAEALVPLFPHPLGRQVLQALRRGTHRLPGIWINLEPEPGGESEPPENPQVVFAEPLFGGRRRRG